MIWSPIAINAKKTANTTDDTKSFENSIREIDLIALTNCNNSTPPPLIKPTVYNILRNFIF